MVRKFFLNFTYTNHREIDKFWCGILDADFEEDHMIELCVSIAKQAWPDINHNNCVVNIRALNNINI